MNFILYNYYSCKKKGGEGEGKREKALVERERRGVVSIV